MPEFDQCLLVPDRTLWRQRPLPVCPVSGSGGSESGAAAYLQSVFVKPVRASARRCQPPLGGVEGVLG